MYSLDLAHIPIQNKFSKEVKNELKEIKKIHECVMEGILKANEKLKQRIDKKKKNVQFVRKEIGYGYIINLRYEHFPPKDVPN